MASVKKTRKAAISEQTDLLDVTSTLRTGPCVPALREAVKVWKAGGYKGITSTSRVLLNYWFFTDHVRKGDGAFRYHASQQEAIETLIFVWEHEKIRSRKALLERFAPDLRHLELPRYDEFSRFCVKMATGSGKTKVIALALAWQYFNAVRESEEVAKDYARTFLLLAPNVIVFERLKSDFAGGRIFATDPIVPKELAIFWDFDCILRGEPGKAHSEGALFLTNIQQFYEKRERKSTETDVMTAILGAPPPPKTFDVSDFGDLISLRDGNLLVINDEAHHTHDEISEWNSIIRDLHKKTPVTSQLDFSATPRFQKGAIFPWTISDYPLKQAILDGVVKRPMKGIAKVTEAKSDIASVRYAGYLAAGVERWREYREQLAPLKKRPILFVMLNGTDEAEDVGDWLRTKYPAEFGAAKTQVIHTDRSGEISKADLDVARKAVREVDEESSPISAIVSVLMLREGWDVQNVTVVVGLRPYTAKANILPEQTIGRGLRLMFRDMASGYVERVDIIGNDAFISFVDDLEKIENLKLETFEVGKDKLRIVTIAAMEERSEFDIGLPLLTPSLIRKRTLAAEIASLDVKKMNSVVLPLSSSDKLAQTFTYEGYDLLTLTKEIERDYTIPEPQTAQEVIGYYARRVAEAVKLPGQFAALAPKVRDYFQSKAFGQDVNLEDAAVVKAMSTPVAHFVCVEVFKKALQPLTIEEQVAKLIEPERLLSTCQPFPWSRAVLEARKSVFNFVPCDNEFERTFAKFLDNSNDVVAFAKLPRAFGFVIEYTDTSMNLRNYEPDFVAIDSGGTRWILETKGQETLEVARKDAAAERWCETASELTDSQWKYIKIPQVAFETLAPSCLGDLSALASLTLL